ncbi:hypothetical protein [Aquibacillus kalidii]|uniref:hypothetical protein n=1 Tax=Aquibacillus kalidii TaxID=2762597 RepID=UPI0016485B79|nr:hypothetical protein [Aquibacillus kalidii]
MRIGRIILGGTLSGILLGMYLGFFEWFSGKKVYTLLLNVDFIPYIGNSPDFLLWLYHLIISWGICLLFVVLISVRKLAGIYKFLLAITISGVAMLSYFPLTLLALRPTPTVYDIESIIYWVSGHFLYGCLLYVFYRNEH